MVAVLGLAGAVAHHRGEAGAVGDFHRLQRLGQGADLVDLDQDGVGGAGRDAAAQALRVGDEQIVADELDFAAQACR